MVVAKRNTNKKIPLIVFLKKEYRIKEIKCNAIKKITANSMIIIASQNRPSSTKSSARIMIIMAFFALLLSLNWDLLFVNFYEYLITSF